MKKCIKCLFAICFVFNYALAQNNSDAIVGTWTVQDGSAKVKIEKTNGIYFGKMVWIKNPNDKTGKPLMDSKNPEVSQRNRPQLGLPLLNSFVYGGDNVWKDGTVYDPDEGKTYSCKITLTDNQTIDVRGYVGISLFGRSETWKRCPDITMK